MPADTSTAVQTDHIGRAFAEVLGEGVAAYRKHSTLAKGALVIEISGARAARWTVLWDADRCEVLDGEMVPPGTPKAELCLSPAGLTAFGAGKRDVGELAAAGEAQVRGNTQVLQDLAECFRPTGNPLNVRLGAATVKGGRRRQR